MIPWDACRLCVITDHGARFGRSHREIAAQAVNGGASMIQLRDKMMGPRHLLDEARWIAGLCRARGACFIVNDRVDLALAADADGVHLGQDDMPARDARALLGPDKIVGVSTHTLDQAISAVEQGADYLGIGPVFATGTKKTGYEPVGCEMIRRLRSHIDLPILAIGGIALNTVGEIIRSGATGVAVISAIVGADDIAAATHAFLAAVHRADGGRSTSHSHS